MQTQTNHQPHYSVYDVVYESPKDSQTFLPVQNLRQVTTNGVCKKFIHGKCKLYDNCPRSHDKSKIKPCNKYETTGQCSYGEKCNFSHDLKICLKFMKDDCGKGFYCPDKHIYKTCPNYQMGFCFEGKKCKFKHIVQKPCWDYMYGYCEKGGKCLNFHSTVLVQKDFEGTKELFRQLSKPEPQLFICNYCAKIGHKVNKCPQKIQIQPKEVFKCGLCGNVHCFNQDCDFIY